MVITLFYRWKPLAGREGGAGHTFKLVQEANRRNAVIETRFDLFSSQLLKRVVVK